MAARYLTQAPEVQSETVSPYIGIYQSDIGRELNRNVGGFVAGLDASDRAAAASAASARAEARAERTWEFERGKDRAIAESIDQLLGMSEAQQIETLQGLAGGAPMGPTDAASVAKAGRNNQKLKAGEAQRPMSGMYTLQRERLIRQQIRENPYAAREILATYSAMSGSGIIQQMDEERRAQEQSQIDLRKYYEDKAIELGALPTDTFEHKVALVTKVNRAETTAQDVERQLRLANAQEGLDQINLDKVVSTEYIPNLVISTGAKLNFFTERFPDPLKMTQEQRAATLEDIQTIRQEALQKLSSVSNSTTTAADIERWMAPLENMLSNYEGYFDGSVSSERLKVENEITSRLAAKEFHEKYPEAAVLNEVAAFFKGMPEGIALELYTALGADEVFKPVVRHMTSAATRETNIRQFGEEYAAAKTDKERNDILMGHELGIAGLAGNEEVSPDQFAGALGEMFRQYGADPEAKGSFAVMDRIFKQLATPEALAKLNRVSTNEAIVQLTTGMGQYLEDISSATRARVRQKMEENFIDWKEVGQGGFVQRGVLPWSSMEQYIEPTYLENGAVVFNVKPNIDERHARVARDVVKDLNKIGRKYVDIYNVYNSLMGTSGVPAATFTELLLQGKLPAEIVAERRAETGGVARTETPGPKVVNVQDL